MGMSDIAKDVQIVQNGDDLTVMHERYRFQCKVARVTHQVSQLRDQLAKLTDLYVKSPASDERSRAIASRLELVAKEGEALRNTLFNGPLQASKFSETLLGKSKQVPNCTFYHPTDSIHIPWSLLYDRPMTRATPTDWSQLSAPQLEDGFWCNKFDITSLYTSSNSTVPAPPYAPLELQERYTLGLIHLRAKSRAVGADEPTPLPDIRWPKDSMFTASTLRSRLEDRLNKNEPVLLYFFGHSKDGELHIDDSNEPVLTPEQLRGLCADPGTRPGLFILNGCGTFASQVISDDVIHQSVRLNWPSVINECGFHGLVGTEAKIPTRFAWAIGRDLLYLILVKGYTISTALRELRPQHWPLSLLYGLYCDPRVAFGSVAAFLKEADSLQNYCDLTYSDRLDATETELDVRVLPFEGITSRTRFGV